MRDKVAEAICNSSLNKWPHWSALDEAQRDAFRRMADAAIKTIFGRLTRVDIIGDRFYEIWADEWEASIQDDGQTLKLYQFGDGCDAKAERDRVLDRDLMVLIRERSDEP